MQLNCYINDDGNLEIIKNLKTETKKMINDEEYVKNNYFCAKYELDGVWYRAKYIRQLSPKNAIVVFVDFGNKETISLDDICIIPKELEVFNFLPLGVNPIF